MAMQNINFWVSAGSFEAPYYRFFTDSGGSQEISDLTLETSKSYTFRRLNESKSHPFYISDTGYKESSSNDVLITGDGSSFQGITGNESFTLAFGDSAKNIEELLYYCSSHQSMQSRFKLSHKIKPKTISSSKNLTLPNGIENLVLTGKKNLKGSGNSSNNRLTGNSGNNLLDGKGGFDVMIGNGGNDTYIVNHVNDRVIEKTKGGNDTIRSSVNELLSVHVENLVLTGKKHLKGYGNNGRNRLTGNSGNNVLKGKGGIDVLNGQLGNDIVNGGAGVDTAVFSKRNNHINLNSTKWQETGDGKDRLISIENVNAGAGNDVVTGNKAANKLDGQKGNDFIYGGGGKDLLIGGGGKDKVWGQGGRDTFRIERGTGYTIIKDYSDGADRIHLGSGRSDISFRSRGDNLYIYQRKDLLAIVEDVSAEDLQRSGSYLV